MLPVHTGSLRRTHYEVLSVSENATYNEIRESYKGAILSTHPDKLHGKHVAGDPYGGQQEMFLSVQKAWEVLSDPKSRENYDKELQVSRNGVEVVDSVIRLEEMLLHVEGDMKEFFYQCRCGDYFSVATFELAELGVLMEEGTGAHLHSTKNLTQASVVLPCSSCSLKIRLMVDVIC